LFYYILFYNILFGPSCTKTARNQQKICLANLLSIRPPFEQCCQVAEIPAKKLKRGRRKKKLAERICGRIVADFTKKWQKKGRRKFSKEVPYF
jgi:hypothetical protein